MINITPQKTQLELNLERINEPIIRVENRIKACVHDLNESFNNFWNQSDEAINEILVFKGVEEITKIFEAHYQHGTAFNKILEDRGISEPRAVLVKPRDLTVNGQGNLELVPLPEPELIEPEV